MNLCRDEAARSADMARLRPNDSLQSSGEAARTADLPPALNGHQMVAAEIMTNIWRLVPATVGDTGRLERRQGHCSIGSPEADAVKL